jgi:triacylglycerol lipase
MTEPADVQWIGCAPHEDLHRGEHPLLPSKDPFYNPPTGYEQARPGTVLRSRGVELAFLGLIPQRFTATQLLYRSTNLNGDPEAGDYRGGPGAARSGIGLPGGVVSVCD